jgi:hypothetical protein
MPVPITCPHCRRTLCLPDRLYRGRAQCPCCHGAFAVRWNRPPPETPASSGLPAVRFSRVRRCQHCGEPLEPEVKKCPECGNALADG